MMRNLLKLLIFTFLLSSCAVKHKHQYRAPLGDPRYNSYLQLDLDDIETIGEMEISYEFTRYLGFIVRIIGINGERPDKANLHYAYPQQTFRENFAILTRLDGKGMRRALYKVYSEFPEATHFQIVSDHYRTHTMFGGKKVKRTSRVKVYKFRD